MKPASPDRLTRKGTLSGRLLAGSLLALLSALSAHADTLYWDPNTTTAAFGTGGTWGTNAFWTADSTGAFVALPTGVVTTTSADNLNINQGNITPWTMAVSGDVNANSLTYRSNAGSANAGTVTDGGSGKIHLYASGLGNPFFPDAGGIDIRVAINVPVVLEAAGGSDVYIGNYPSGGNNAGSTFADLRSTNAVNLIAAIRGAYTITSLANFSGTIRNDKAQGTLTIGTIGTGVTSVTLNNTGSGITITGQANAHTGTTIIDKGTLNVAKLANIDTVSSIGKGTSGGSAADIVFGGGTLQYNTAAATSTDRLFTIGDASGLTATLDSSQGTAANSMSFTNTGSIAFGGSGARTLTLTGSNTGTNTLAPILGDGTGGATSLIKSGNGSWTVSGNSTYTGPTTVSAGTLILSGSNASATGGITATGGTVQFNSLASINGSARNVTINSPATVAFGPSFGAGNIPTALTTRILASSTGMIAADNYASTNFDFSAGGIGYAAASFGSVGNVTYTGTFTPNGTTYRLGGGAGTLTLSNANAVTGAANTLLVGGNVSLTAANDISTVTVNSGNLTLGSANGALNGSPLTLNLNAGSLILDNTGTGNNNNNRLTDAAALKFGGGTFNYRGFNTAGTNSSETIGNLSLISGQSTTTVTFGSTNKAEVTAGTLTRSAGAGTLLVNGIGLGKNDSATTSVARFLVSSPTLVGTTDGAVTGINAANKDTKIVPFLVGEATTTTGGIGTAGGTPNTFVTWNATAGLRPLNPTDEFTNNAVTSGTNTRITAATVASATASVNSLVVSFANASALTINDGFTLTDTSGALLFTESATIKPSGTTGALDFGSAEGIVTVNSTKTGTITAPITGSGGLTKSGTGTLTLSSAANSYSGATSVMAGTLNYFVALSNTGVAGPLGTGSSIDLGPGTSFVYTGVQGTNPATDRTINLAGAGSGTVTLNGSNVNDTTFTFNGPITATGTGPRTLLIRSQGDRPVYTYAGNIPDMSDGSPVSVSLTWGSGSSTSNGIINLKGVNTFTGPLTLTGGANGGPGNFLIGALGGNVGSNVLSVTPGGTGVLGNGNYAGNITFASGTTASVLLTYASASDQILSGVISGPGALTKTGTSTLTLSGANTYSGITTVSQGKLVIDGTHSGAGALNVSANATLGGKGTVSSNTTIANNGKLAFNLSTVAGSHDKFDVTGTLTFTSASTLDITATGVLPAPGIYTLVTTTGGITGVAPATLNLPPDWVATTYKSGDNLSLLLDVTSTGSAPEIAVEDADANNIPDGGSKAFGTVINGANTTQTFTIKNTGSADLTGLTYILTGSTDFSVTASPTAPVSGPSGTTTFTVQFAPTSTGLKNASIAIANNDSDENPFDINLSGTGISAFDSWATVTHGLSGGNAAFDFDNDNDGIPNGMEWILGGNPTVNDNPSILPTVTGTAAGGLTLAFNRASASIAETTLTCEWNTDLSSTWNSIPIGSVDVGPSGINPTVDIDAPDNGKVTVNIPAGNAGGGKVFARLKATKP